MKTRVCDGLDSFLGAADGLSCAKGPRRPRCDCSGGPTSRNGGFLPLARQTTPHKFAWPASVACNMPCPGGQQHVPSRRKKKVPFRPVVNIYNTVPSRREKLYEPSRPFERKKKRPVPSRKVLFPVPSRHDKKVIVLYRPVPSRNFTPNVPSRPIQPTAILIILPSRPVPSSIFFAPNVSKQSCPIPSRIFPAMNSLEENRAVRARAE